MLCQIIPSIMRKVLTTPNTSANTIHNFVVQNDTNIINYHSRNLLNNYDLGVMIKEFNYVVK